ncbi:MAG: tRNA (adenosine(37)-N6)-threonylcarbamoyltransferase complex dimerization subunit type 1 TsaB [Christensenellaceae bacterium]|jgi:tRNA threonylcarbamoyl adenosine modification protein YeaZ|nr:tRNA (adenosine(37)-N6)-threonylcarbamoyltransferase complex dimerization subunit type 1 TsaB [Christensenellaceae bacterium]
MNILVLDTSSDKLLLALLKDNEIITAQKQDGKYMEVLLPMIDELLQRAKVRLKEIDVIGVVVGPGSFTGVRIGVSTVKGFIHVFRDIKIVAINSLELIAYTTMAKLNRTDMTVVIPSTANKLYVGRFKSGNKPRYSLEDTEGFNEFNAVIEQHYNLDINAERVEVSEKDLIDFCCALFKDGRFGEFKPYYLALSQAEEELLKKEGSNA